MPNVIVSSNNRFYHDTVIRFLNELDNQDVRAIAMVALTDDGNAVMRYDATDFDLLTVAGLFQARGTLNLSEMEVEEDDETEIQD